MVYFRISAACSSVSAVPSGATTSVIPASHQPNHVEVALDDDDPLRFANRLLRPIQPVEQSFLREDLRFRGIQVLRLTGPSSAAAEADWMATARRRSETSADRGTAAAARRDRRASRAARRRAAAARRSRARREHRASRPRSRGAYPMPNNARRLRARSRVTRGSRAPPRRLALSQSCVRKNSMTVAFTSHSGSRASCSSGASRLHAPRRPLWLRPISPPRRNRARDASARR